MTYDSDIAAWAAQQAALLRRQTGNELDWQNLAEEIEAVGKSQENAVFSRLKLLCQHLLKWQYQHILRSPSWRSTIRVQRRDLARLFRKNPSLRQPFAPAELPEAYAAGREDAIAETGIENLPDACPWTLEDILDPDYWPGGSEL